MTLVTRQNLSFFSFLCLLILYKGCLSVSKSHDKSKITQNSYEFKGITSCVLLQFQSNQELYNYICSILTCSQGCQFLAYWREPRCQRVARLLPAVPVHMCSLREVVLGESTSSLPSWRGRWVWERSAWDNRDREGKSWRWGEGPDAGKHTPGRYAESWEEGMNMTYTVSGSREDRNRVQQVSSNFDSCEFTK